jgi:hypothetical protein
MSDVETWRSVVSAEGAGLLAAVAAAVAGPGTKAGAVTPAALAELRERYPREQVEVALELVEVRRRAAGRFTAPDRLIADRSGLEQASGSDAAAHKALRFGEAMAAAGVGSAGRILDLCCGIGGDAMALAGIAGPGGLVGIERSPLRAWMAGENLASVREAIASGAGAGPGEGPGAARVEVGDIAGCDVRGALVHVDPDRRVSSGGDRRRLWRYAECRPGPEILEPILAAARGAALKLGPGIDFTELPERASREVEILGGRHGLVQAVVWCGELARAPGRHTATRLVDRASFTAVPDRFLAVADAPERFLLVPDPALERAQLVAARVAGTSAVELAAGLGLLTSPVPLHDAWFTEYEILAVMPWRQRKIQQWLAAHDAGLVVVRTRGAAVRPEAEQRALRGAGDEPYTLFGLRTGQKLICLVTR